MSEARTRLPIRARIEAASLFRNDGTGWREVKQFKLGSE